MDWKKYAGLPKELLKEIRDLYLAIESEHLEHALMPVRYSIDGNLSAMEAWHRTVKAYYGLTKVNLDYDKRLVVLMTRLAIPGYIFDYKKDQYSGEYIYDGFPFAARISRLLLKYHGFSSTDELPWKNKVSQVCIQHKDILDTLCDFLAMDDENYSLSVVPNVLLTVQQQVATSFLSLIRENWGDGAADTRDEKAFEEYRRWGDEHKYCCLE